MLKSRIIRAHLGCPILCIPIYPILSPKTTYLHRVTDSLSVSEDFRQVLASDHVPKSSLCQKSSGGLGITNVRHRNGSIVYPEVDHSVHCYRNAVFRQHLRRIKNRHVISYLIGKPGNGGAPYLLWGNIERHCSQVNLWIFIDAWKYEENTCKKLTVNLQAYRNTPTLWNSSQFEKWIQAFKNPKLLLCNTKVRITHQALARLQEWFVPDEIWPLSHIRPLPTRA